MRRLPVSKTILLALAAALACTRAIAAGFFKGDDGSRAIASPGGPVRGESGDTWADVVIGKPDFTEISPNDIVANRVFQPGGIVVDRSSTSTPNKVCVYDSGNNRVLRYNNPYGTGPGEGDGIADYGWGQTDPQDFSG